jgi:hypothetical protein
MPVSIVGSIGKYARLAGSIGKCTIMLVRGGFIEEAEGGSF